MRVFEFDICSKKLERDFTEKISNPSVIIFSFGEKLWRYLFTAQEREMPTSIGRNEILFFLFTAFARNKNMKSITRRVETSRRDSLRMLESRNTSMPSGKSMRRFLSFFRIT